MKYQDAIQKLSEALLSKEKEIELDVLKRKIEATEKFYIRKVS